MMKPFLIALVSVALLAPTPAFAQTEDLGIEANSEASPAQSLPVYTLHYKAGASPGGAVYYMAGTMAAILFLGAGFQMTSIRSVAGNTTAEAYYQGMGYVSYGLGLATIMQMAAPFAQPKVEEVRQQ